MSINLPDLPENYRWLYREDYVLKGDPVLVLQIKRWWGWSKVGSTWVHAGIWGNEQTALDNASKKLSLLIQQSEHYGVYSTRRENDY